MKPPLPRRLELPAELLTQIGADSSSRPSSRRSRHTNVKRTVSGRRALRKQIRLEKKAPKARRPRNSGVVEEEVVEDDEDKDSESGNGECDRDEFDSEQDDEIELPPVKKIKVGEKPRVSRAARAALEDDDAQIKRLEKRLGIKKKQAESGISVLEGLNDIFGEDGDLSESEIKEKEEYDTWLASKRTTQEDKDEDMDSSDIASDGFLGDEIEEGEDIDTDGHDEWSSDGTAQTDESFGREKPKERENPYRPPVSATKYVPPSLRPSVADDTESLQKLKRQLQGSLNKLTESNMPSILQELDKTLSNNARQYVFGALTELIVNLIADISALNDSFLILHAAFVCGLYRTVGTQFAAQLVERVSNSFLRFYEQESSGKEANNLVGLLAGLYSFQVIGSNLMFDYLRLLLQTLSETNTELLLKIIRNTGPLLRKDDPASLKDIVIMLQKAVVEQGGEQTLSVRTKFMIETIIDLKNNRPKAGPAIEQTSRQIVSLKKVLGGVGASAEPLGISLADLQRADKTGKWWLVGAGWKPVKEAEIEAAVQEIKDKVVTLGDEEIVDYWADAVSHDMNTDVKRSIFVAIQSAFDAKHALIQLRKQSLNVKQRLEIPGVLLDILGLAESYNPFYRLIAQEMCAEHRYRKAFQFKLWEVFRQLGEPDQLSGMESRYTDTKTDYKRAAYLGKFYGELLALRKLPITIVRVCIKMRYLAMLIAQTVDFLHLQKQTKTFIDVLLVTLFESVKPQAAENREEAIKEIFSKAKDEPREMIGLRFRIQKIPKSALLSKDLMKSKAKRRVLALAQKAADVLDQLALRVGA
jgi:hypothetical protein